MLSRKYLGILLCLGIIGLSRQDNCNATYDVEAKTYYITSQNYPEMSSGYACHVKIVAPQDHDIFAECDIYTERTENCYDEKFVVSRDGDLDFRDAEKLCGHGKVNFTSNFRSIAFYYDFKETGPGGRFLCQLTVRPQPCDCGWSTISRIVGGKNTKVGEYPSVVGVYNLESNELYCSATIINHRYVLTAAHCMTSKFKKENLYILAGFTNISDVASSPYFAIYEIEQIIIHPSYSNNKNDIALLRTTADIEWSRGVGPACLPFYQKNKNLTGIDVKLLGWGTLEFGGSRPDVLQNTNVGVISTMQCVRSYPDINTRNLCTYANGRDACQFDSGGPVILTLARQILVGIISYGTTCADNNPGVNTRVTSFLGWIRNTTNERFC